MRSSQVAAAKVARAWPPDGFVLPAPCRLRSSRDFDEVIRQGRRAGSTTLVLHALRSGRVGSPRAGFVVSGAVGNAVTRNRVKRRLRHLARPRLDNLPTGTRLVLRPLSAASNAPIDQLARDLDSCLRRLRGLIA